MFLKYKLYTVYRRHYYTVAVSRDYDLLGFWCNKKWTAVVATVAPKYKNNEYILLFIIYKSALDEKHRHLLWWHKEDVPIIVVHGIYVTVAYTE